MSETLPSLTANGQKLIDRLLTLPQGWVTAAMLAESIGVSRRTVLRELPSVEQWIAAAGYRFVRSPGQGLLLDEPPARREQMRALLNGSTVYAELPRRQRRQKLLGMLLQAREPMTGAGAARLREHTGRRSGRNRAVGILVCGDAAPPTRCGRMAQGRKAVLPPRRCRAVAEQPDRRRAAGGAAR